MNRQFEFKDKLVLKNATLRLDDYAFLISALVFLYFILTGNSTGFLILLFIGLLVFTTFRIIKRVNDRSDKIIIDKYGIKLCEQNEQINWSKIKFAYLKQKTQGVGRSAKVVDYFHIETTDGEIAVDMRDLKFDKELLKQSVEHFSGRDIGDFTDKVTAKVFRIIGNDKKVKEIETKMSDYFKSQSKSAFLIVIGSFGLAIFLQLIISFPYIIASWWSILVFCIIIYAIYEDKTLKKRLKLNELSDRKFKTIKKEYGAQYDLNYSKIQTFLIYAFLIISVFAVFAISYYFDISRQERGNNKLKERTEIKNSLHNTVTYCRAGFGGTPTAPAAPLPRESFRVVG
ncbi:hypothetical protein [Sunxiuqinia dokdonensis]|uniref:Uncharacterized protein n=1 Tax=Sunxiuqinia dokdonensis TaxID=1409788 RepID=A0A0L8V2Y4_9BACT|nr:hypothetical protein [Sunxiuqinia dokdonensis]KOH42764.1 hypothetical protein NC99_44360 [Sunxiuqinia dokdonensis]